SPVVRPPPSTLFPYTTLFRSCAGFDLIGETEQPDHPILGCHHDHGVSGALGTVDVLTRLIRHSDLPRAHQFWAAHDHRPVLDERDRKSTRLNSSHVSISYAVF